MFPVPSMACPDPSAHQSNTKLLQEQASTAALYVTNPLRSKPFPQEAGDMDQKLASAGELTICEVQVGS